VALEKRDGDIDAVHWRCQLASVLLHPETPGQDPDHSTSTVHAKIDFDLVPASTMLRLRMASRPVFLAAVLSGRSRLHTTSDSNASAAVTRDVECRWRRLWSVNDEVCKVSSRRSAW